MGTDRAALGQRGERQASEYLTSLGYEIIECNYRCKFGEVDIIARESGDLVFVEVKSRRSKSFGFASESVDSRKQHKLILSAQQYLIDRDLGEIDSRFDVVEVYFESGKPVQIEAIKGAFGAGY